jgi:lipopolysaccharide assembly outer membrane protein LptD (OstA)
MKRTRAIRFGRLGGALLAAAVSLSLGLSLRAQSPAVAKKPAADRKLRIKHGDLGSYKETPAGAISTISGNVVFAYEDTTLNTDAATYNHKTQVATSPGRVQIDDAQNTLTGDQGVAYYKTKKAAIRGNVRILARPRPENQNAPEGSLRREFKDPVIITCDRVDYNWRTRVAVATGDLTLRQKERTVTADRAVYEGRQERVTLIGNVRGVTAQGDEIRGEKAVIILREGAESLTLTGIKGGSFKVEEEIEDEPGDAGDSDAPGEPAAPGAQPRTGTAASPPAAPRPSTAPGRRR